MKNQIPNIFHFIFGLKKQTEPFHLCFYICLQSCIEVNNPEKIYFYYYHEPFGRYWDKIKSRLTLVKIDPNEYVSGFHYEFQYRKSKKYNYAHHSDFIRLEKLIEKGGVYADMDTIFVNKIPENLFSKSFVLGREKDVVCHESSKTKKSLCNAFIMAEKGAPFAKKWLKEMPLEFNGSWSNHSTLLPQKLSEDYPELIHIEPERTFYKHMWTKEGIHKLFKGLDTDFKGVVSFHLWSHLWWSRFRVDFSTFYAGKINEAYIKRKDTTYNILARKYLS